MDLLVQDGGIGGSPCSTASDWLPRALQKLREKNRTAFGFKEMVSVKTNSAPRTHHGGRSDQCPVCHRPLQPLTDASEVEGQVCARNSVALQCCGGRTTRINASSLARGVWRIMPQPSALRMVGIVQLEGKWYSRNNRRLWCSREAVITGQVRVGGADTRTDGAPCGLLPAGCVQGVWRGVCRPHDSAQLRL